MQKNKKKIKLWQLILKRIILFIVIYIFLYTAFSLLFETYIDYQVSKSTINDKLDIDLANYSDIDNNYLIQHNASIEVINQNTLTIIEKKGVESEHKSLKYTKDQYAYLLKSADLTYDYEDIDDVDSIYNDILKFKVRYELTTDKNGNQVTVLLKQFDEKTSKKMQYALAIYFLIIAASILLIVILFIKSIYNSVNKEFLVIQKTISQIPERKNVDAFHNIKLFETEKVIMDYNATIEKLEAIKREKDDMAKQSNRLISNLSHDLKSPITTLKGYSEVMLNGEIESKDQKQYLEYINKSATDLNELVAILLEQVKYQYIEQKFNFEEADMNNFLRDICANYYMIFEKKGFSMSVSIDEEPCKLYFDKVHIKRVFTNILENCLSHNPEPTDVFVSAERTEDKYVICFMNNGVEIKKSDREKIFDPFYKKDYARNGNHYGLGLHVSKQIIEKHGGRIYVTENKDYKTIFLIELNL